MMHPYATMPFIGEGLDPPIYEPQQHILSSVYALTGSENVHTGQPQGFYYATAAFGALEASYPLQIINRRTGMKMGMRPPPDSQMLLHGIPRSAITDPPWPGQSTQRVQSYQRYPELVSSQPAPEHECLSISDIHPVAMQWSPPLQATTAPMPSRADPAVIQEREIGPDRTSTRRGFRSITDRIFEKAPVINSHGFLPAKSVKLFDLPGAAVGQIEPLTAIGPVRIIDMHFGSWKCEVCDQIFRRRQRAVFHYWNKHGNVRLSCKGACGKVQCDKTFACKEALDVHMHPVKTTCRLCSRKLLKKNILRHRNDHCPYAKVLMSSNQ